jgi:hypothetical protein
MKHKYWCKKCNRTAELEDQDPILGELKKVTCTNCKGGVKMWKIKNENK